MRRQKIQIILSGALFAAAFGLTGCSNDSDLPLDGVVVQSPVKGATVFADKLPYNGVWDSGEKKANGQTDENGRFSITIPSNYGVYRMVSVGGTDKSGNPGVTMLAPPFETAGKYSGVITPISSLFALTSDPAKLQKTLGITAFTNPFTETIPPATLAVMKATETVLSTFTTAAANNPLVAAALQMEAVQQIANTLTANNSAASIQSTTAIETLVTSASNAAITKVTESPTLKSSLVVTNPAALQTAISNSVAAVVAAVNAVAPVTGTTAVSESATITGDTLTQINTALTTAATESQNTVIVTPEKPKDTTAPDVTISSKPAASTMETTATFAFSSTDETAIFLCSLDSAAFSACTSPKAYSALAVGNHTFSVKAVDPTGNVTASPQSFSWDVVTSGSTGGTGGTVVN